MNDIVPAPAAPTDERLKGLKDLTMVTYILYALSCFTGLTAIVAVVINYVKLDDARGTIYESHFNWQIRTFWWSLLWAVIGFITMFIFIGILVLLADAIWVIYRIVKGFLYWNDNKPIEATR